MRRVWWAFAILFLPLSVTAQDVSDIGPFLKSYCLGCHNQTRKIGAVMLDVIRLDDVSKDAEVWEKILRQLRAHTMPMPSAPTRPDDQTYDRAIAIISNALDKTHPPSVYQGSGTELANRLAKLLWN